MQPLKVKDNHVRENVLDLQEQVVSLPLLKLDQMLLSKHLQYSFLLLQCYFVITMVSASQADTIGTNKNFLSIIERVFSGQGLLYIMWVIFGIQQVSIIEGRGVSSIRGSTVYPFA